MKGLLSQRERDHILERIQKQRFSTSRKNVAPWCMQWIALAFAVLFLVFYFTNADFGWTKECFFGLAWLLVAILNHNQWERYKEQSILREKLDASNEHRTGQASSDTVPNASRHES